jgi:peptide chain release factor 3
MTSDIEREVARRRTFAIISHPDAGKTTLTEKLLLYGGAIRAAGSVKRSRGRQRTTSDWMEIERERGISISTSVLQFDYAGCRMNLLDTPGHNDFSEDTYRTLAAADSAVMLIDSVKGVEPQTIKLFEVCRLRGLPIATFINKMDCLGRPPLEVVDEIEQVLGIPCCPLNWPVGSGPGFEGVYDRERREVLRFERIESGERAAAVSRCALDDAGLRAAMGERAHAELLEELALLDTAGNAFDYDRFLAGQVSPVFFGSAMTNFGVQPFLDRFVELAPPPRPRQSSEGPIAPTLPRFSGFVFKIQANMDPAHRDRIAFVRVASGHFERGMKLKVTRSGKELKPNTVVSFLSQRRELLDEAFAGDIIGIPNHGVLQLGDTLTEGEPLQFTGLPFFAPEMFRTVEVADPLKTKQLKAGLTQLGEEGAIQVFRPVAGTVLLLGAVGQLQFEVVAHRLEHEYGCKARIQPARYSIARWVTCDDADGGERELQRFIDGNAHRMAHDAVGAPTILVEYAPELRAIESNWPKIKFHALREHAGLVFQKQLDA